jgi:hypothetical protein
MDFESLILVAATLQNASPDDDMSPKSLAIRAKNCLSALNEDERKKLRRRASDRQLPLLDHLLPDTQTLFYGRVLDRATSLGAEKKRQSKPTAKRLLSLLGKDKKKRHPKPNKKNGANVLSIEIVDDIKEELKAQRQERPPKRRKTEYLI